MTVFFTSDLHLFHHNIIKYSGRPFRDVDHMNEALIHNYNEVVGPSDTCIFIGDVCMGKRVHTVPTVARLNGYKILAPGNHDDCHPMYADKEDKWERAVKLYSEYFDEIANALVYTFNEFLISHFPYNEHNVDYKGRDFSEWEPVDEGMPLLCGHIHEKWRVQASAQGSFMLNVGVDVNDYRPISYEEVLRTYHNNR